MPTITKESGPAVDAAGRLRAAELSGQPCAPVRDLIGADDITLAYEIQRINLDYRYQDGNTRTGRKIGLTSPAVQQQLGVDTPDFGTLLDDMVIRSGQKVPAGRLLQPKVEAEVAFWLSQDLAGDITHVAELRGAISGMAAAIEIVDSRIANWDITLADTVADNASSGMFVVSDRVVPLGEVEPVDVVMQLSRNDDIVSTGKGAACLGDPLAALLWLAQTCYQLGDPLRAGEVVLSGALGPMVQARPGDRFVADISGLGSVSVSFEHQQGPV